MKKFNYSIELTEEEIKRIADYVRTKNLDAPNGDNQAVNKYFKFRFEDMYLSIAKEALELEKDKILRSLVAQPKEVTGTVE